MPQAIANNPPTVLVVDDDPRIVEALKNFLRREGCDVISANDAQVAARTIGDRSIDLVISDIRPDPESGVTMSVDIKRSRANLPVILITGYPEAISEADVKALGADYLFGKPLDLSEMRNAIRTCLRLPH